MRIRIVCALAVACACLAAVSATDVPRPEDRQLAEQCYPAMFGYTRLMTALFPDDHVPAAEGSGPVVEREKAAHLEWLRTLKLTRSFAVLLGKEVDAQELGGKIEKCIREYTSRFGEPPPAATAR